MRARGSLRVAAVVLLVVVPIIISCGGGGGSSAGGKAPGIYGTAAKGLGQGHRPIEVGDRDGNHDTGQTDGKGDFSIPTTKVKTPPYLLRVITSTTPTTMLYSVSADENAATTVNITPLTDLIIRSWYSSQTPTVDIDHAFTDLVNHPAPKPETVSLIQNLVKNVVQLWLDKNGVTAPDFNLISTPFTAGTVSVPGTGIDKVLDQAWVNAATGQLMISDGTTTQNTTLNAFLSSLTASTTTVSQVTGSAVDSGFNDLTSIPTNTVMQAALAGINATVSSVAAVVSAKGVFISANDLLPYIDPDPNFRHDGYTRTQFAQGMAASIASGIQQGKTDPVVVKVIKSLDTSLGIARVVVRNLSGNAYFRKVSGSWLISGNGQSALIAVGSSVNTRQGNPCPGCSGLFLSVRVDAPAGIVSSVSVTGGIWSSPTNVALTPTVIGPGGISLDRFWLESSAQAQLPPKDTPFMVTITKTAGGTESFLMPSNAYTTEAVRVTNLTTGKLADITLGSPLFVQWTKPVTFPIQRMAMSYQAYTSGTRSGGQVCTGGVVYTTNSGNITIPATCSSQPVQAVNLGVHVTGSNGEQANVVYTLDP